MKSFKISLDSVEKVKDFNNLINKFDGDFDLISGDYLIDAKSIMGIFSLDLTKPLVLQISNLDNIEEFENLLQKFITD